MGPQISGLDRWFVTDGVAAVGPVSYNSCVAASRSGRIPSGSFVRHDSWKIWRRLEARQLSAAKREAVQHLAAVSAAAENAPATRTMRRPPTEEELGSRARQAAIDAPRRPSTRQAFSRPPPISSRPMTFRTVRRGHCRRRASASCT